MPTLSGLQFPPPKNWQDFETLCCDLWRAIWNDPNTQKNGREGQPQHGVDVFGRPNLRERWAGIQCKGKDNYTEQKVTEKELRAEVEKAKAFTSTLSEFTIATTASRDVAIQEAARKITNQHGASGLFSVHVWSWEDIVQSFDRFPDLVARHYPHFFHTAGSIRARGDDQHKLESPLLSPSRTSPEKRRGSPNAILKLKTFRNAAGFPQPGWAQTFSAVDPCYAQMTVNEIIERLFSTSDQGDLIDYLAAVKSMYRTALQNESTLKRFVEVCDAFGVDYRQLS